MYNRSVLLTRLLT